MSNEKYLLSIQGQFTTTLGQEKISIFFFLERENIYLMEQYTTPIFDCIHTFMRSQVI